MGIVAINDGTILAPGLRFEQDLNTGLIRTAADTLGYVAGGVLLLKHSTGAFAFQEATTISTSTGDLVVAPSGYIDARKSAIGATPTDILALWNVTDAAAGAQQYSGALRLHGEGWKTDATAASQNVDARIYLVPIQGAAVPTANLYIDFSINDAAFANRLRLTSAGSLVLRNDAGTLQGLDSGGTPRDLLYLSGGNNTLLDNDAAGDIYLRTDNASGVGNRAARLQIGGNVATAAATWTNVTQTGLVITSAQKVEGAGTGANGFVLKNVKNAAASALSGTQLDVEIDIGGTPYYFTVYPTKA